VNGFSKIQGTSSPDDNPSNNNCGTIKTDVHFYQDSTESKPRTGASVKKPALGY